MCLQKVETGEAEGVILAELSCVDNDMRVTIFSQVPRTKEVLSLGE